MRRRKKAGFWGLVAAVVLLLCLAACSNEKQGEETGGVPTESLTAAPQPSGEPEPTDSPQPTKEPELTEEEKYWNEVLASFADSEYDLTDALTGESLQELCGDYFLLGAAMTGAGYENLAIHSKEYMAVLEKHFGSTTATNLMKPCHMLNQPQSQKNAAAGNPEPAVDFGKIESTLAWCMEHGVKMRGHTLVWHTQVPDWFFREGYENDGAFVDRETMLARLDSYIRQVLSYCQDNYPGVVYCWDVVNEAVDPENGDPDTDFFCRTESADGPNLWYTIIGSDYVEQAFRIARKYAAEGVSLIYNDYSVVDAKKCQYIYNLCKDLADKELIDGIGLQGYWGIGWPSLGTIDSTIRKLAELGLEIQITELSIDAEEATEEGFEQQAKRYAAIFERLQRLDTEGGGPANITSVTLFGLMDGYVFYDNDESTSRWFDTNFQPKPVVDRVRAIFKIYY